MTVWRTRAALFGKAPWHDEFLRPSAPSGELHEFDDWLFRNAHALGPCPTPSRSYAFLTHLGGVETSLHGVAGVVRPSCDRAGRPFPLAIAASIALGADIGAHAEVAPILLESYWNAAIHVVTELGHARSDATERSFERLTDESIEKSSAALDLYAAWSRQTTVSELCAVLSRSGDWLVRALQTIIDAAAAWRSRGMPRAGIRVPLGPDAGSVLCFWLEALRLSAGWRRHVPSFFWSTDEPSGDAVLFFGSPGDATLASLWQLGPTDAATYDLTAPTTPDATWGQGLESAWLEGSLRAALQNVAAASAGHS